jgi:hypothetical protein
MTSENSTTGLASKLRAADATVSKWGYGVSGWAGVVVGGIAMFAAQSASETAALSGVAHSLVAPLVWLVAVYGLLALAYRYRQRRGGPSCSVR